MVSPLFTILPTEILARTIQLIVSLIVFFGVITPIGILFRIIGRDSLNRRFEPQTKSYWVPHAPPDKIERYFRDKAIINITIATAEPYPS